jgi:hypothetical protein
MRAIADQIHTAFAEKLIFLLQAPFALKLGEAAIYTNF